MVAKSIKKFFGYNNKKTKNKKTSVTTTKKISSQKNPDSPVRKNTIGVTPQSNVDTKPEPVVVETPIVEPVAPPAVEPQPSVEKSIQREPSVVQPEPEPEPEPEPVRDEPEPDPEPEPEPEPVAEPEPEPEQKPTESVEESIVPDKTRSRERSSVDAMSRAASTSKDETFASEADENTCVAASADDTQGEDDLDVLQVRKVDTMHAEVRIPRFAKEGDYMDIEHNGDTKTIKVPSGTKGGDEFTVRFITNNEIEPSPSPFCCM